MNSLLIEQTARPTAEEIEQLSSSPDVAHGYCVSEGSEVSECKEGRGAYEAADCRLL